jgi:DNA polymerase III epsilon subunit-like protein
MKKYKHLVVDIETLGVDPGSAVVAIGAVVMQADAVRGEVCLGMFEGFIETVSACEYGVMNPETVKWWAKQNEGVRGKVMGGKQTTREVLEAFVAFVKEHKPDYVWANSPSFDLEMLKALFRKLGMAWPLSFRQERDSRTLRWLAGELGIDISAAYDSLRLHDPLSDAYADGRAILMILRELDRINNALEVAGELAAGEDL